MRAFDYSRATSRDEAVGAAGADTRFIAGGTDLLTLMKADLVAPRRLIDLRQAGIADTIEEVIRGEKGLPPNLDWPSARLYHYLGLEVELYTPLFVASRVVGWAAHVIEQAGNNRLIRPRSRYTGSTKRNYVPLEKRG